jgi:two-component system response regulator MprA
MPTILVADDYPAVLHMLHRLLESFGFEVLLARDGAELLRIATATPPDLVLTNVEMPGLDGIAATERLRAQAHTRHIPVIVQSANEGHQWSALQAGARRFFVKPAPIHDLVACIEQLLDLPTLS